MLNSFATLEDVRILAQYFAKALPEEAQEASKEHAHPDGRQVYTEAVWTCFNSLRAHLGEGWSLYPAAIAKGPGKAGGEYLVDFMLMDGILGPRIACESELGRIRNIDWALDKLRGVKSDIKILLFEDISCKRAVFLPGLQSWPSSTWPALATTCLRNSFSSSSSARIGSSAFCGARRLAGHSVKKKSHLLSFSPASDGSGSACWRDHAA